MKNRLFKCILAALLLVFHLPLIAEDIDLFSNYAPSDQDIPNVLIIIDNTANWSKTYGGTPLYVDEMAALKQILNGLPANKFRVGLMMFSETGGGNNTVSGAAVRAAIRLMTDDTENPDSSITYGTKTLYGNLVNGFGKNSDKANGGDASLGMAEAYLYFSAGKPYAGYGKVKADALNNSLDIATVWSGDTDLVARFAAYPDLGDDVDEIYANLNNNIYALTGEEQVVDDKTVWVNGNALLSGWNESNQYYNSPVTSSCQPNYIIYLSNDNAMDSNNTITNSEAILTAAGGDTTRITDWSENTGAQKSPMDEWARFMRHDSDLGIITYTVDVNPVSTGQGPNWSALLRSVARQSDGRYFSVETGDGGAAVAAALRTIFSEIQAKDSVFASVSLPVSVNTQGTYLNQVFVGMFRPDASAFPRWNGNLKQYKLGYLSGEENLKLLDADNAGAIGNKGFVYVCARSYWTPTSADDYWFFSPMGDCDVSVDANESISNSPDGDIVEKGGQAYKLRSSGYASRTVYTCGTSSCSGGLFSFAKSNVTDDAMLTALSSDVTARDTLIDWSKGANNKADTDDDLDVAIKVDTPDGIDTATRPSTHGDVVHSRPVAINFADSDSDSKVVVFYGANDGMLRAINGNRDGGLSIGGSDSPGEELWSFMPPEFYEHIQRLRDNTAKHTYLGSDALDDANIAALKDAWDYALATYGAGSTEEVQAEADYNEAVAVKANRAPKPYGMDGSLTAYKDDTHTWIFSGMRRGGSAYYAFDVSSPTSPSLLWRKGCVGATCDTGFSEIGQTWSSLNTFKASGQTDDAGSLKPLLIVGGGYDTCEDADPQTCTSDSHDIKGNKVFVLDAETGGLIKTFDTDRSVVADVFVVTKDYDTGEAGYAYAADTGGNVYRITLGAPDEGAPESELTANWSIKKIASLGCDPADGNVVSCTAGRKFLFHPDIIEKSGVYYLLIGSGDREKPLLGYTTASSITNHFFMIKDNPSDPNWLADTCKDGDVDVICKSALVELPADANTAPADDALNAAKGWYLNLATSEQVVTSAITVFGTVTFSTHQPIEPEAGVCGDLGNARVYNIYYADGTTRNGEDERYERVEGGGLPPSPIAGLVTLDDGDTVPFVIGAKPSSPLEGDEPEPSSVTTRPKTKVYWYIEQ